jgi:hypothetical protein
VHVKGNRGGRRAVPPCHTGDVVSARGRPHLLAGVLVLAVASGSVAAVPVPTLPPHLPPEAHARVEAVASRAAVSTRVEGETFVARPELFEFLLDHPGLASDIARALRYGRYRIWRSGEGLVLDDGWGAKGVFTIVHAENGRRVVYARGRYESEWLPDIRGQAVVAIDYLVTPADGGRSAITPTVTGFLRLDTRFADSMARLAGALAQKQADRKARRLARTFAKTTHAIEADPAGVYALVKPATTAPAGEVDALRQLLNLPAEGAEPPSR